jgi:hypothetical protein
MNLDMMELKLQTLEEEFKSHKISMKELESLALASDGDPRNVNNNDDILENPLDKTEDKAVALPSTCSASVGLDKKADSDINVI